MQGTGNIYLACPLKLRFYLALEVDGLSNLEIIWD